MKEPWRGSENHAPLSPRHDFSSKLWNWEGLNWRQGRGSIRSNSTCTGHVTKWCGACGTERDADRGCWAGLTMDIGNPWRKVKHIMKRTTIEGVSASLVTILCDPASLCRWLPTWEAIMGLSLLLILWFAPVIAAHKHTSASSLLTGRRALL